MIESKVIAQIAFVVRDIEETGQKYADFFGIERPPVIDSGAPEITQVQYKGEPSKATCKMMFFDFENLQLELIQPDESPSIWRDVLNEKGEGFHHIAFQVKGAEELTKSLADKGYPTSMKGFYGDASGMYAYLDTEKELKTIVELLESF